MTLLIYDCDGVLVDSEVLALETLRQMMAALGRPMTMAEADREFTGGSLAATLATAERLLGRPVPADIGEKFGRLLFERLRRELKPVPGVREAILCLPYRRCVASSSSPDRLRLSLNVTGLAPLFEHVFSAVQVANGKPAPDLYLLAASAMGEPPARCIVIEDAVRGAMAGRAAGARVIGFAGAAHASPALAEDLRRAGAEAVIEAMHELPAVVRRLIA